MASASFTRHDPGRGAGRLPGDRYRGRFASSPVAWLFAGFGLAACITVCKIALDSAKDGTAVPSPLVWIGLVGFFLGSLSISVGAANWLQTLEFFGDHLVWRKWGRERVIRYDEVQSTRAYVERSSRSQNGFEQNVIDVRLTDGQELSFEEMTRHLELARRLEDVSLVGRERQARQDPLFAEEPGGDRPLPVSPKPQSRGGRAMRSVYGLVAFAFVVVVVVFQLVRNGQGGQPLYSGPIVGLVLMGALTLWVTVKSLRTR
jgi:hypothetical protein